MRLLHYLSDVATRMKNPTVGVVTALLCTAAVTGWAQDLKLSEVLANQTDEAVVQLLRDLANDQQARAATETTPEPPAAPPVSHSEAAPVLMWVKDLSFATPPLQEPPPAPEAPPASAAPPEPTETKPMPAPEAPVQAPVPAPVAAPAPPSAPISPVPAAVPLEKPASAKADSTANAGRDGLPPLGVGDQITIAVFGQPDLSAEVTVGESGTIMVPLIGTLNVLNLSAAQLEAMVATRLKDGGYLQNPGVSVQIRQLRSQLVSVIGEVQRPGRYPIQGRMTVLEALATAGGLTQRADKTIVLLRKPASDKGAESPREEISIQLETAGGQFGGRLDAPLLNDDVVFVGVQKLFYIHGEVRRPGAYPMETGMNIMKALSLSGGVSERGSDRRIKIHRLDAHKVLQEMKADPATPLQPDDVIHVDERLF